MKKFLIRLLIIIAITLVADRILYYAIRPFYKRTTTTDEFKLNSVMYKMNEPIVLMGSSRCHHNYNPLIIADSLQQPVFNAGLWGARNIYFQYGLLCNILQNYTPQTICYEIHPIDYLQTPFSKIDKAGVLAPFINYSDGCDEVLKKAGRYYQCEVSDLYRYNSEFINIIMGNLSQRSSDADKGQKALHGELDTVTEKITPEKFPFKVDNDKMEYLQKFIDKCKEKKIQLIFLFAPMYVTEKNNALDIPDSIAQKNGIPFINHYSFDGLTGHAKYFYDFGHLNEEGSKIYSTFIASELKKYIVKK